MRLNHYFHIHYILQALHHDPSLRNAYNPHTHKLIQNPLQIQSLFVSF
ncbi:hypothetical protein [Staphylococcus phage vB_SaS_GE1]|nr:hypothetical protein [Staphylococcus phage vB_SaS_GE1]